LTVKDLAIEDIFSIFSEAEGLKREPFLRSDTLKDKVVGLIFQKPSNRTRVSFEVGVIQLGGHSLYLGPDDIKFGQREAIKDIARVLSRYVQVVALRTFSHKDIEEFAMYSHIPVINALSDLYHPCQALADIFTIKEKVKDIEGKTLCFIGDGNNVLHSLLYCASKVGMNLKVVAPKKYGPNESILRASKKIAKDTGCKIEVTRDIAEGVRTADVIYTDVWVSMGQEAQREKVKHFKGLQVNDKLLKKAKKDCLVMHCLPAHRGQEITDSVIEGKNSIVFDQAENRLHIEKAIMVKLIRRYLNDK